MPRARSGTSDLTRTFAVCTQPVYLLNSRRAIVYANDACAAWLGIDADQLLGARCDYHSLVLSSLTQTVAAGLCPPPEAFAAAHCAGIVGNNSAGQRDDRQAEFFSLHVPDEAAPAMLVVVGAPASESIVAPSSGEPSSAELHVLLRWLRQTLAARPALERWVGDTPEARRVRDQAALAIASAARVMIVGPRGSGRKELARAINYHQRTATIEPLVTVDCAVMDAESLQMAITSLLRHHHAADPSRAPAVLLQEVDALSVDAQHELLGFLELPGFEMRTLATAQQSLIALADAGSYNRPLAHALSTLVIELPPLQARLGDLPLLAQALVEELNASGGKQISGLTSDALERLANYRWPGDMAQLAEAIKAGWTSAAGSQITLTDLPRWLSAAEDAATRPPRSEPRIVLDDFLADVERELIARAMSRVRGNKAKAARLLGISRPRLLRRMEQLGLVERPLAPPGDT